MAYNYWKMTDRVTVAIKTSPDKSYYGRVFNGYVADASDDKSIESAKEWASDSRWNAEKQRYVAEYEPELHTFDNEGFTVKILESAGGSSQGGRLSFLACEVEKDGVKFVIGVNDALLVDLIRNSEISKGQIKEKVMFVRKGGQPGFIHEGMDAYREAVADMKKKADLKTAKKTSKWEIGGIYSSLTQTDFCLCQVWDHYEEVTKTVNDGWWRRQQTTLEKREKPVKVYAWVHFYNFNNDKEMPTSLEAVLTEELEGKHISFRIGKPPARAKAGQLEVSEKVPGLLDKLFKKKEDQHGYGDPVIKGRYTRVK